MEFEVWGNVFIGIALILLLVGILAVLVGIIAVIVLAVRVCRDSRHEAHGHHKGWY